MKKFQSFCKGIMLPDAVRGVNTAFSRVVYDAMKRIQHAVFDFITSQYSPKYVQDSFCMVA